MLNTHYYLGMLAILSERICCTVVEFVSFLKASAGFQVMRTKKQRVNEYYGKRNICIAEVHEANCFEVFIEHCSKSDVRV